MIITMRHVRKAGMCSHGGRAFAKKYNFDWNDFLRHGVEEEILLDTKDAMMIRLVEVARGK